jgi:hypothetical protein
MGLAMQAACADPQAQPSNRPAAGPETAAESPAVSKNPTFLFRTISLSQEWDQLAKGDRFLTTSVSYTEPFRDASLSLGISIPFAGASRPTQHAITLGDIAFKGQWIPYLTPHQGVLVTTSLTLPTSQDDHVGDGKWMLTPSMAYARFWGPRFLLAQFVQHQASFAGPARRPQVNRTDLDLYGVYSGRSLRWWINGDINLRIDEANHRTPSSVTISYGRGLRKLFGGSLNGSVQAGRGIGRDRPYDAMLTGGISLVGFHYSE